MDFHYHEIVAVFNIAVLFQWLKRPNYGQSLSVHKLSTILKLGIFPHNLCNCWALNSCGKRKWKKGSLQVKTKSKQTTTWPCYRRWKPHNRNVDQYPRAMEVSRLSTTFQPYWFWDKGQDAYSTLRARATSSKPIAIMASREC